ncbi:MAG: NYN domain-containing protein [Thermoleophilia bacterium]
MERFAVFIDAGYLYAASGRLLFDNVNRRDIVIDFAGISSALKQLAAEECTKEHLRTYWYDGARELQPTPEHLEVANLPAVKLRLGRLTRQGQKGVDSRIVRDLIILSSERAMTDAYLIGGDEDLREGVSEAQERGVRVILVGIDSPVGQNLSPTLAMEADDVVILDRDFVAPHFRRREPQMVAVVEPSDPQDPVGLGRAYAVAHLEQIGQEGRAALLASKPVIPPDVDRLLLSLARNTLRVAEVGDEFRKGMRRGFWLAVEKPLATSQDPSVF